MGVGADMIGILKANTKGFFKGDLEKTTKDFTGVSHLVLKKNSTMPGDMPLIYIGYTYNVRKALSFIAA